MLYSTVPSAVLALTTFTLLGYIYPVSGLDQNLESIEQTLAAIQGMFRFHILLLLPPLFVLYASIKRKAALPTLVLATLIGDSASNHFPNI